MTIYFNDTAEMEKVLGINDSNLAYLESLAGTNVSARGNRLVAENPNPVFRPFMEKLASLCAGREAPFAEHELYLEWRSMAEDSGPGEGRPVEVMGRTLWPKTKNQRRYIESLKENQIVFAVGPAGTGKTFIATGWALSEVLSGRKQKIVLTRPVVEAGESLGYLPGDLSAKLNPYLKPLYDAMEHFLPPPQIRKMEESGMIEVSPLAYMRGRSLNRSVVILDEAQNTTKGQMKMFLTRLGEDSQAVVTGDLTQIDLPRPERSGLAHAVSALTGVEGLDVVEFRGVDIIRSRLVRAIIERYAEEEADGRR